jgi:hypothetical protein
MAMNWPISANWDLPVISGLGLWLLRVIQSPSQSSASWGDQVASQPLRRSACGAIATVFYARLLAGFASWGCWLSRQRSHWCDRVAPTLTLTTDCSIKPCYGTLQRKSQHWLSTYGEAHPCLICLDGLMPVSPCQAISPGSFLGSGRARKSWLPGTARTPTDSG